MKPPDDDAATTQRLSREHTVLVSKSGLVTVIGGKGATYRVMAEDVMETCFAAKLLAARTGTSTEHLPMVGAQAASHKIRDPPGIHLYGSEAVVVQGLPGAHHALGGGVTKAMVRFAARYEYATMRGGRPGATVTPALFGRSAGPRHGTGSSRFAAGTGNRRGSKAGGFPRAVRAIPESGRLKFRVSRPIATLLIAVSARIHWARVHLHS